MYDYFNPYTASPLPTDHFWACDNDQTTQEEFPPHILRSHLRIYQNPPENWDQTTISHNLIYATGDLLIDRLGKMIYKNYVALDLTPTEYALVLYLVEHSTMFCSRDNMRSMINNRFRHHIADNTLSKHVHRTRGKLGQNDLGGLIYVLTRNSRGYKWNLPVYKCYVDRK